MIVSQFREKRWRVVVEDFWVVLSVSMEHFIDAFRNYSNFSGRATRSQFWAFQVVSFIVSVCTAQNDVLNEVWNDDMKLGLTSGLWTLAVIVPSLAIISRRLHDAGKSGWMGLLLLLPFIGWIWVAILLFLPSELKPNPVQ